MIHEILIHVASTGINLNCGLFDGTCTSLQIGANIADGVNTGVQNGVKDASGAVLNGVASGLLVSWQQFELQFLTSWLKMPNLVDLNNPNGTAQWLSGILLYFTGFFTVLGMLFTSIYLLIALRGDRARKLGVSLVMVILISNAGPLLVYTADVAVVGITTWLLSQADITANAAATEAATFALMPGVFLIAAIIAIAGVLIQWGIMLVRASLIPLFVGVWPLSAAIATLGGKATSTFEKITAWLIAFLIYPIPAAIVYVTAFRLKSGYDGIGGSIAGMILEVLAIFALPALFRIIAPHTAALGKAYGGAIALKGAITAAETAVAVGAAVVTAGAAGAAMGASQAAGAASTATKTAAAPPSGSAQATGGPTTGAEGSSSPTSTTGTGETTGTPTADGASTGTSSGSAPAAGTAPAGAQPTNPGGGSDTAQPGNGSTPSGAQQQPAANSADAGAESRRGRRQAGGMEGVYARQQAAQAISGGVGRTARESIDDVDEIIGGKHHE